VQQFEREKKKQILKLKKGGEDGKIKETRSKMKNERRRRKSL
jgi:hypothetical protein